MALRSSLRPSHLRWALQGDPFRTNLPWEPSGGGGPIWSPLQLTLLRAWWRADTVTLVGADVESMTDLSGVGNTYSAPVPGNRPLWVSSHADFNSQPVIEGDGAGEYLTKAAVSFGAGVSAFTFWVVARAVVFATQRHANRYHDITIQTSNPSDVWRGRGPAATLSDSASATTTAARLVIFTWDGATQRLYIGSTLADSDANAAASQPDSQPGSLLGTSAGAALLNGRIAEGGLTRAVLTDAERASLAAYCAARYGTAL